MDNKENTLARAPAKRGIGLREVQKEEIHCPSKVRIFLLTFQMKSITISRRCIRAIRALL